MKILSSCIIASASLSLVFCNTSESKSTERSRRLNYVKLQRDFTNWKRIIDPDTSSGSTIIPILADMACKACSKISDPNKRKQCIMKFCQSSGGQKAPMSAAASAVKTKLQNELFGDQGYSEEIFPGILDEFTNMLCSLCSNMPDPVEKKKCVKKLFAFCSDIKSD
ncbi:unnamed protein product [Mytilus coruscus]|uniref:Uncharacterized protein n=1 Tax=Mytilus coruscus TaxID=42192 RepID=A0A6J7ZXM9_MYTCO|nr:unnamed protein product [Mytilus coruscus]